MMVFSSYSVKIGTDWGGGGGHWLKENKQKLRPLEAVAIQTSLFSGVATLSFLFFLPFQWGSTLR